MRTRACAIRRKLLRRRRNRTLAGQRAAIKTVAVRVRVEPRESCKSLGHDYRHHWYQGLLDQREGKEWVKAA